MERLTKVAKAKINLGLDVLKERPDGYHELEMVMQSISLCDTLTLEKKKTPGIRLDVQVSPELSSDAIPPGDDNLAFRAADLLMREFSLKEGLSICLEKKIPPAAGLGGGSADAAAVLLGVNELFDLKLTKEELMKRGLTLGADVPYCILGGTALAKGVGEKLTPLQKAPRAYVLLAKPPQSISTAYVYQHLRLDRKMSRPDIEQQIRSICKGDLKGMTDAMGNVLEQVSVPLAPVIGRIKERMKKLGALGAQMSGSGPTVFGLFDTEEKARTAYEVFLKDTPENSVYLAAFS